MSSKLPDHPVATARGTDTETLTLKP